MVENYDYIERFSEHETVSLIIVNSSAVLEIVPGGYPEITNADFIFTEADVEEDAMHISESLNAEQNLKFGSINPSKFEVDIFNKASLSSLKDTQIAVYLYFDGDSSTLFQVGVYVVKMDEYSDDRSTRHLTCFDVLQDLYDYDITKLYNYLYKSNTVLTIKELRDAVFEWLSTPKNQTTSMGIKGSGYDYPVEQEETDLVNDDFEVEKSIESDVVTFGFLMQGLLEANGVFGHIDRTGVFRYISLETYDQDPKRLVTEDDSFKPVIYEDYHVWGIGYVAIWNRNNLRIAYEGSSAYTYPSVYNIIDSFVFSNNTGIAGREDDIKQAALNLRNMITHMWYYPIESECEGNLCYEVGDRINLENVTYDEETDGIDDDVPIVKNLYSYILQREFTGLQEFIDLYVAKGDRKQPRYKITNDNWHEGDSGSSGSVDGNDGTGEVVDDSAIRFIKYCRNIGIRLLQEPSVNLEYVRSGETHQVEITWSDPSDITNYKPVPCEWAGTIVVRSESKPPVHPWDDCEILVNSTTRDEYSETSFVDNTIEENKKYYYGIFPYHIALDDAEHPIKYYRFTKVISVNTQRLIMAPLIVSHSVSGTNVTLTIEIPVLDDGTYSYVKAVAKKGSIPASKTDGTVIDLSATATSVTFSGLDEQSHYYFVIFANDGGSDIASDPDDCFTDILSSIFEITASSTMEDSDGIVPTVIEGGGTYSEENGYYCTASTILEYAKNLNPEILKNSGYIDFVLTGINNNGYGAERDTGIQLRTVDGNTMVMAAIFANGTDDYGSTNNEILRVRSSDNNTIYEFQNANGSALDVNKNEWHDVKIRAYISNNKWVKGECYVDGSLWLSYDVADDVTVEGWNDVLNVRVEIIGNDGIKSCKVTRKFED